MYRLVVFTEQSDLGFSPSRGAFETARGPIAFTPHSFFNTQTHHSSAQGGKNSGLVASSTNKSSLQQTTPIQQPTSITSSATTPSAPSSGGRKNSKKNAKNKEQREQQLQPGTKTTTPLAVTSATATGPKTPLERHQVQNPILTSTNQKPHRSDLSCSSVRLFRRTAAKIDATTILEDARAQLQLLEEDYNSKLLFSTGGANNSSTSTTNNSAVGTGAISKQNSFASPVPGPTSAAVLSRAASSEGKNQALPKDDYRTSKVYFDSTPTPGAAGAAPAGGPHQQKNTALTPATPTPAPSSTNLGQSVATNLGTFELFSSSTLQGDVLLTAVLPWERTAALFLFAVPPGVDLEKFLEIERPRNYNDSDAKNYAIGSSTRSENGEDRNNQRQYNNSTPPPAAYNYNDQSIQEYRVFYNEDQDHSKQIKSAVFFFSSQRKADEFYRKNHGRLYFGATSEESGGRGPRGTRNAGGADGSDEQLHEGNNEEFRQACSYFVFLESVQYRKNNRVVKTTEAKTLLEDDTRENCCITTSSRSPISKAEHDEEKTQLYTSKDDHNDNLLFTPKTRSNVLAKNNSTSSPRQGRTLLAATSELSPTSASLLPPDNPDLNTEYLPFLFEHDDPHNDPKNLWTREHCFELPTCPYCLERLDVSVSGVVCHSQGWLSAFQWYEVPDVVSGCRSCYQLVQGDWLKTEDGVPACPHCPPAVPDEDDQVVKKNDGKEQEQDDSSTTSQLLLAKSVSANTNSTKPTDLWLCLVCGYLGCGRYAKGQHSLLHGQTTGHRFCLELKSGRIWDYAGDVFVHRRLVQSFAVWKSLNNNQNNSDNGAYRPLEIMDMALPDHMENQSADHMVHQAATGQGGSGAGGTNNPPGRTSAGGVVGGVAANTSPGGGGVVGGGSIISPLRLDQTAMMPNSSASNGATSLDLEMQVAYNTSTAALQQHQQHQQQTSSTNSSMAAELDLLLTANLEHQRKRYEEQCRRLLEEEAVIINAFEKEESELTRKIEKQKYDTEHTTCKLLNLMQKKLQDVEQKLAHEEDELTIASAALENAILKQEKELKGEKFEVEEESAYVKSLRKEIDALMQKIMADD
ncbi:unnamed protein product [Amoebophrya sp. A120]|nr:unnamed protein product [Amoebophrya sp. A120]|eukprot:GSA120T00016200001.1